MKTFAKILLLIAFLIPNVVLAEEPIILYSHQSTEWTDFNTWTLEPSGKTFINPDRLVPNANTVVVILAGVTVEVPAKDQNDHDILLQCKELTVNGILKLNALPGHEVYGPIKGNGLIDLKADNYPACTINQFITDGGTVVFDGTDVVLTTPHEYSNLKVKDSKLTIAADITCHGSLSVVGEEGTLLLNAPTAENPSKLIIEEDLVVNIGCFVSVAKNSNPFDILVYGNFNNDGTVNLSTRDRYGVEELTSGYANVHFVSDRRNQTVNCNRETNFYRIYMNKGTDATFKLKFTAYNRDNFHLCAPAETDGQNNLILENGTIEIGSNIIFPFLHKTKFTIPSTVTMLVNAGKVNTESSLTSISVLGKLLVQGTGEVNAYDPVNGITLYRQGVLDINSGTINTTRIITGGGEYDYGSYYQTGGIVNVNGITTTDSDFDFSLGNENSGFYIEDGVLNVARRGIQILSGDGSYTVLGGVINLDAADGKNIVINSNSSFPTLNITSSENAAISVSLNGRILRVIDNFSIGNNVSLQTNNDVYIGGNLNVEGQFVCNDNTIVFNSSKNSELTLPLNFQFVNLTINKSDNDKTVTANNKFSITNDLTVQKGTFVNGDNNITIAHDIIMSADTKILSGSGQIVLQENLLHTLHSELRAPALFGNLYYVGRIYIDEEHPGSDYNLILNGPVIAKDFKFGDGAKLVELNGHYVEVTGKLSGESETKYFLNNGSVSGGLRLHFTLKKGEDKTIDFPIGDNATNNINYYTPAQIVVTGSMINQDITGSVRVNVVGKSHPNLLSENNMQRYWVVDQAGFDNVAAGAVQYNFDSHGTIPDGLVAEGLVALRGWKKSDIQNINGQTFSFKNSEYGMLSGDFTCALEGDFVINMWRTNPAIKWTKDKFKVQSGQEWTTNASTLWRKIGPNGETTDQGGIPGTNDIVYIYINRVDIKTEVTVGQIIFVDGDPETIWAEMHSYGEIDDLEHTPRITLSDGVDIHVGRVSGEGVICQCIKDNKKKKLDIKDMTEFAKESHSWIMYKTGDSHPTINGLELYDEIPNLALENGTYKFHQDLNVNYDLNMRGKANISFTSDYPNEDITIGGNLYIGDFSGAKISYNADGPSRKIVIKGNLDFTATNGNSGEYNNNERKINVNATGKCPKNSYLEHRLIVGGNIITGTGSKKIIDLFLANNGGYTGVVLELNGNNSGKLIESDYTYANTTPATINLWKIEMNKTAGSSFTINRDFVLKSATDAYANKAIKPITMTSGHLIINNNTDKEYVLSNGGGDFVIGTDAVLTTTGKAQYKVKNSGIKLFGGLRLGNCSQWQVDNSIEYSESGKSEITITNATLTVGQQIRPPVAAGGSLLLNLYNKVDDENTENTCSPVLNVGTKSIPNNQHGILELENMSRLNMDDGAVINIFNLANLETVPDINLDPARSEINKNASFVINTNNSEKYATILSKIAIPNLTVKSGSCLKMMSNDLTVIGKLNIEEDAKFATGGYKLFLKGDVNCEGLFNHENNTTYFCGNEQQNVNGSMTFYNLEKNTSNTVKFIGKRDGETQQPLDAITILNNADFLDGEFAGDMIITKGNVTNNAIFRCSDENNFSESGFVFQGDAPQILTSNGSGYFDVIRLSNPSGVKLITGNSFTVGSKFKLETGTFDLGTCTITMDVDAVFMQEGQFGYSASNMIQVSDAYATGGVRKIFGGPTPENTPYFIPIGTTGKYTPVSITANSINEGAAFIIRPVNEPPNCIESSAYDKILNYYWNITTENVTKFEGKIELVHVEGDAKTTDDCALENYIAAIQYNSDSKFGKTYIYDIDNRRLEFVFPLMNSNSVDKNLSGKYIAGCSSQIPDKVREYISVADGDWFGEPSIWRTYDSEANETGDDPVDPPVNAIVYINSNVTIDRTVSCYETHILKELNQGVIQHNYFGTVYGTGKLISYTGDLPAGVYDDFNSRGHGTIHFNGDNSYSILSNMPTINNLIIDGEGVKDFPNLNIQILGDLTIKGNVDNSANAEISLMGHLNYESGKFNTGDLGKSKLIFNGDFQQRVYGSDFSSENCIFNIVINNEKGVKFERNVFIKNVIEFQKGIIDTKSLDEGMLTLDNPSQEAVIGYGEHAFVDGPFCKRINNGEKYTFPIGCVNGQKQSRYGELTIQNTETYGSVFWVAQYFYQCHDDWDRLGNDFASISSNEYWSIYALNGKDYKAQVVTRWDNFSQVTPQTLGVENVRQVHFFYGDENQDNMEWRISGTKPHTNKDGISGYIASDQVLTISSDPEKPDLFTFGFSTERNYGWLGIKSDDWFDPENWVYEHIPSKNVKINLGGNPPHWPVINYNYDYNPENDETPYAICHSLTLSEGASLVINSLGGLTVNGDVDISADSKLTLLSATSASPDNHTIAPTGSLIYKGQFNGKLTFQRFVRCWEYERMCVPVTGYNANVSNFLYGAYIYKYNEDFNLDDKNTYTYKSGENQSQNPAILAKGWERLSSPTPSNLHVPYRYLSSSKLKAHSISFTGTPLTDATQNIEIPVQFTPNDVVTDDGYQQDMLDGWNFVANPFVSSFDANELVFNNVDAVIYLHDNIDNQPIAYAVGPGMQVGAVTDDNCRYIAAGQSFFVHATKDVYTDGGSVVFPPSSRSHGDTFTKVKSGNQTSGSDKEKLVFVTTGKDVKYQAVVYFVDDATEGIDSRYDAYMQESNKKNMLAFYSFGSEYNVPLVANGLPFTVKDGGEISLGYSTVSSGKYTISLPVNTVKDVIVYLKDTENNTVTAISEGYSCTIDVKAGTNNTRFKLLFKANNAPVAVASVVDTRAASGEKFELALGTELFADNDPGDYVANIDVTSDGGTLPTWLSYDYQTGTFSGNPLTSDEGVYHIAITATDSHDAKSAPLTFTIKIVSPSNINSNPDVDDFDDLFTVEDPVAPIIINPNPARIEPMEPIFVDVTLPEVVDNTDVSVTQPDGQGNVSDPLFDNMLPLVEEPVVDESEVMYPISDQDLYDDLDVKVYPVPSHGPVTVEFSALTQETGTVQMTLVTISGRVIVTKTLQCNSLMLDLTGRSGVYLIRLATPSRTVTKRIIIQ